MKTLWFGRAGLLERAAPPTPIDKVPALSKSLLQIAASDAVQAFVSAKLAGNSQAREHRLGLWLDPEPAAPWDYSRAKRLVTQLGE
ncbi:MAG: hypothetical protein CFE44_12420 [Burkholderiales bacterium PBB4]|nr:MAG: hypothetical protein CFE44_12420 [Burkholderiales bacterium PBB4]